MCVVTMEKNGTTSQANITWVLAKENKKLTDSISISILIELFFDYISVSTIQIIKKTFTFNKYITVFI